MSTVSTIRKRDDASEKDLAALRAHVAQMQSQLNQARQSAAIVAAALRGDGEPNLDNVDLAELLQRHVVDPLFEVVSEMLCTRTPPSGSAEKMDRVAALENDLEIVLKRMEQVFALVSSANVQLVELDAGRALLTPLRLLEQAEELASDRSGLVSA